jgi:hypothetical protein
MRLWSLHPEYLDPQGLVALWREALLAQAVLRGATRGYRSHPQLERFRAQKNPVAAIGAYLAVVQAEAGKRGYSFDAAKIASPAKHPRIAVTTDQLEFERRHLLHKLEKRSPAWLANLGPVDAMQCHPLFRLCPGPVEAWERGSGTDSPSPLRQK